MNKTRIVAMSIFASAVAFAEPTGFEWENNQLLSEGKEPTRAAFSAFSSEKSALKILPEYSENQISLDSDTAWKFKWVKHPAERPAGFWKPSYDVSDWETIKVPCSWEAMGASENGGWGTANYTNVRYPFRQDYPGGSRVMLDPPSNYTSFIERNPVGSYRRDFELPKGWEGSEIYLKFDGVDSFFYLWVNGKYVGFSKDSRSPAEFNVSKYLKSGKNTVALEVYKFSDGSYLEDQDMFRLSGIFRRTWLLKREYIHVRDFFALPKPVDSNNLKGEWKLDVEVTATSSDRHVISPIVEAKLFDWNDNLITSGSSKNLICSAGEDGIDHITLSVDSPKLWSAEDPNCYKLVLALKRGDATSDAREYVSAIVGFRTSEIKNGRYYFNNEPIKLKGANRHETHPMYGHFVPLATHELDVHELKEANCNTVRNSHYPQDDYWYYLCNVHGIYLVDEANVESHGYGYGDSSLSHRPEWTKATVDRDMSMVERNKNHPSVVIWSYGNEAGPGENFRACEEAIKARDTSRPTHYERDWSCADMEGCQYPNVSWVQLKAKDKDAKKPFYISEYAHNMVNAMGNLKDYQDAIESSDVILGATIWDWVDQGLYMDKDGKRIIAFGGDFGDQPNDGAFVMNGCVLSDRTREPGFYEIKHVYQNWTISASEDFKEVLIFNKNHFISAAGHTCEWTAYENGLPFAHGEFNLRDLKPRTTGRYKMPAAFDRILARGNDVQLRFTIKRGEQVVATDQIQKDAAAKGVAEGSDEISIVPGEGDFALCSGNLSVTFSTKTGSPVSIKEGDKEYLIRPWKLDVYRAPSSNEVGLGNQWLNYGFYDMSATALEISDIVELENGDVSFSTIVEWSGATNLSKPVKFMVASRWTMRKGGVLACTSKIRPFGPKAELARVGWSFISGEDNPNVTWYGAGPFENYADRKSGAFKGLWILKGNDFFVPYARNEDCGNREDTEGLKISNLVIRTLSKPFAFEVNPYTPSELIAKIHPSELDPSSKTYVGIFAATRGLGGASCGPAPMERDVLRTNEDYDMSFTISLGDKELMARTFASLPLPELPELQLGTGAKIVFCSSREPNEGEPDHLIDGDLSTYWHTQYGTTVGNFPHVVVVDLTKEKEVRGFRFWQRQYGTNGMVKDLQIETSLDGENWDNLGNIQLYRTVDEQTIELSEPVKFRYYRLTALNNFNNNDFAALAEVEVITK